jgi:hypothetical protein
LFKDGACPSESGAAGTTPQEVKQSALWAIGILAATSGLGVLAGTISAGDIFGAIFASAPEGVGGGTTQLFRTVGSAEARDIGESGVYRNPAGLEGKYFYPTQAQAENLGAQYAKLGLGEQTLTSGQISTGLLNQLGEPIAPAGEGPAFFLRNEQLPFINNVTIEGPLP